jgi:hypothetical protein
VNDVRRAPRVLRLVVYALLLVSAAAAFLLADNLWALVRNGTLPEAAALAAPAAFTVFVIAYAIDRYLQVTKHSFPFARAAFQVCLAVIFLVLLWPRYTEEMRETREARRGRDPIFNLLEHHDDNVRAAACELAGLRQQLDAFEVVSRLSDSDRSQVVREACARAVAAITAARPVQP